MSPQSVLNLAVGVMFIAGLGIAVSILLSRMRKKSKEARRRRYLKELERRKR